MAENRVTSEAIEVGIRRSSVPGDARVTTHVVEIAMLKNVAPGAFSRITTHSVEVGVLRVSSSARAGDFFFAQS